MKGGLVATTDQQVQRAIHLVDTSGVAEKLEALMIRAPQGRRRRLPIRTWLIGGLLAIDNGLGFKAIGIYRSLRGMSIDMQWQLQVRTRDRHGQVTVLNKAQLDYIAKSLPNWLVCTRPGADLYEHDLTDQQLDRRRAELQDAMDALLDASKVHPHRGGWFAADGSSTWSWGRAPRKLADNHDVRTLELVTDTPDHDDRIRDEHADREADQPTDVSDDTGDAHGDTNTNADDQDETNGAGGQTRQRARKRASYDYDAAFGSKTAHAGGREPYFGYVLDALVRVAPPGEPTVPMVIERLIVSPASTDVVAPTFRLLDSLTATGTPITDLVIDRHYSYKQVERWADPLRSRNINQHFDLRADEQGFRDLNGAKLVAGWLHCPATPDELANIPRPASNADSGTKAAFARTIDRRHQWALARDERPNHKGRARFTCPAIDGKLGCPLRPDTVEVAKRNGLPVVTDPPKADTAPACCTNASGKVTVNEPQLRKHDQPSYWGTGEWEAAYNRRTYVEGVFGSIKSNDTEGISRDFTRYVGIPMMTIGLTLAAAVANVRHQRKHHTERGDELVHPLLDVDPEYAAVAYLTPEQAAVLDQHRDDQLDQGAA